MSSKPALSTDLTTVEPPPVETEGSASATGFDAFFEWLVRAEVACERGLAEAHSFLRPMKQYSPFIPFYVAHWLQNS